MYLFKNSNIRAQAGGDPHAQRAAAGARFLDERNPGWENRINTETLSIASGSNCALGQVYGSYSRGLEATGTATQSASLGFAAFGGHGITVDEEYRLLTEAWRKEVQDRRSLVAV